MAKSKKYYVVWEGHKKGVFNSWEECQKQIKGYAGAVFKSFSSLAQAEAALKDPSLAKSDPKRKKPMYYVVWRGLNPGIYTDWTEAAKNIRGSFKPIYKTFGSKELAEKAYREGPTAYMEGSYKKTRDLTAEEKQRIGKPIPLSLAVDAACNGDGIFEYQGVLTDTKTHVFHFGPETEGTNNIGEFLALVHALAYLKGINNVMPIYSDSRIAMKWVKTGVARTSSKNPKVQNLIIRAEKWVKANKGWPNEILKWETKAWGEIPADFGRK
jgi:ribonuclease HI